MKVTRYLSKSNETLSWGSLLQVVAAVSGAICAGMNCFLSGIENLPFLLTNSGILLNLLALIVMKYKYNSMND